MVDRHERAVEAASDQRVDRYHRSRVVTLTAARIEERFFRAVRLDTSAAEFLPICAALVALVVMGCDTGNPTAPPPIQAPEGAVLPTQPVGTLPGDLATDVDGNAVWTMPIDVPPGRAGMQPELSLTYSSGGGSGLLGVGFAIAGLESRIARCTHALESGGTRRLQLDERDRLCLDGEPLLLVEDGHEYWEEGSQYTTESESTTRVTVVGVGPDGPSTFRVEHADARIATYAVPVRPERVGYNTLDGSRPTLTGAPNFRWALRRLEDRHGNAVELDYETRYARAEDGEPFFSQRVRRITYTRWRSSAGRRSVDVIYEPRPDVRDVSVAGIRERLDARIAALEMHAPTLDGTTHLAWSYRFEYESGSNITGRSRLASVRRCDAFAQCLPSTGFTWSNGSFDYVEVPLGRRAGVLSTQLADVDGDGRDDLVVRDSDGVASAWRSDGAGLGERIATTGVLATAPIVVDLTGDGRAELVGGETRSMCLTDADCDGGAHCARFPQGGGSGYCAPTCRCLGNDGVPFALHPSRDVCPTPTSTCVDPGAICGDLDADDVAECIATGDLEGEGWRVYRFVGGSDTGVATGELVTGHTALPGHGSITFADLDGDGAPDLLRRDADSLWSFGANTWGSTPIFEAPSDPSLPAELVFFDPRPGSGVPVDEHRYRGVVQIFDLDRDGTDDVLIPFPPEGTERMGRYRRANVDGTVASTNLGVSYRDHLLIDADETGSSTPSTSRTVSMRSPRLRASRVSASAATRATASGHRGAPSNEGTTSPSGLKRRTSPGRRARWAPPTRPSGGTSTCACGRSTTIRTAARTS